MGRGSTKGSSMQVLCQSRNAWSVIVIVLIFLVGLCSSATAQAERRTRQDLGEVLTSSLCQLYPRDDEQFCTTEIQPLAIRAVAISINRSVRPVKHKPKNRRRRRVRAVVISDRDGHLTSRRRALPKGTYVLRLRAVAVKGQAVRVDDLQVIPNLLKVKSGTPQFLTVAHKDWDSEPILVSY